MKSGVTLQQMLTEVKRQSESKEDYLIAPNRLRMESYGKEMFLHLSDDSGTELIEPMTITGMIIKIPSRRPQQQFVTRPILPKSHRQECRAAPPGLLPKLRCSIARKYWSLPLQSCCCRFWF